MADQRAVIGREIKVTPTAAGQAGDQFRIRRIQRVDQRHLGGHLFARAALCGFIELRGQHQTTILRAVEAFPFVTHIGVSELRNGLARQVHAKNLRRLRAARIARKNDVLGRLALVRRTAHRLGVIRQRGKLAHRLVQRPDLCRVFFAITDQH